MVNRSDLSWVVQKDVDAILSQYQRKELVEMTHEFIKEYILAADRKASILMTGLFGLLGLSANAVDLDDLSFSLGVTIMFLSSLVFSLIAIICAGFVIYPRKYKDSPEGFRQGYIYWERIIEHGNREKFVRSINKMEDEQPLNEIEKNVYNMADIASRKYSWLRRSMTAVMIMFYFSGIGIILSVTGNYFVSLLLPSTVAVVILLIPEIEEDYL